jgi:membrane-bound serine protease (ClpP class)
MLKLVIILYLAGVILLAAEIYIPGGIIGAVAVVSLVLSIVFSFIFLGVKAGFIMLAVASVSIAVAFYLALKFFPKSRIGQMLFLNKMIEGGVTSVALGSSLVGKKGSAMTDLRPSGTARIEGRRVDVVTQGDYIRKDQEIEVIAEEGSRVVVKAVKKP